ncbi:hypothetical protein HUU05_03920 [candidate division KSB1 bacterium]|nr:hypothetical protein [candidate division KSB1 bacterium]
MSNSSISSQKPRRAWLMPALVALVAVLIEVAGNLVANDLDSIFKPYRTVVWMIFGIAALVAVAAAIWEARRTPEPSTSNDPAPVIQKRNVAVGGDVKESTIITGDGNVVKSDK